MSQSTNQNDLMDQGGRVEFAEAEPRHYDRVPSIVDHLTYIDEVKDEKTGIVSYFRKRLTPTEKELYRILRYRAGKGACWRDTEDLASHVGCSKNTITEAKRSLSMPFEQLEGDSLIDIQEKYVRTEREGKCINRRPVHIITVNNVWRFNNAFMDALDHSNVIFPPRKELLENKEAEICIEKLGQPGAVKLVHNSGGHPKKKTSPNPSSQKEDEPLGSSSQNWDVNKDNLNKDHCLKTNPKANALGRCFLTTSDVEKSFSSIHDALDSLQKFGIKIKVASKLVKDYTLDQMILSFIYLKELLKKKEAKKEKGFDSIQGYFLLTIKNQWYEPKPY